MFKTLGRFAAAHPWTICAAWLVGGLLLSQFLTLYITPVFYTYMEAFLERYNAWREGREIVREIQPATKKITAPAATIQADHGYAQARYGRGASGSR